MEVTTQIVSNPWNSTLPLNKLLPGIVIHSYFRVMIGLFHVFVTCGIPGNLLVLLAFIKFQALRSPTTLVVLNQCFADLLTCVLATPYTWFNYTHSGAEFIGRNKYLCLLFLFVGTVMVSSSAFNVFAMSMERFIAIVMPFQYYQWVTLKSTKIYLAILWSIVIFFACPPLLGWNSFNSSSGCSPAKVYGGDYITYLFLIPNMTLSILTIIANVIIGFTALRIKNRIVDVNVVAEGGQKQPSKSDFKIMKMFMMVIGAFYATWLPYTTLSIIFYIRPSWLMPNMKLMLVLYNFAGILVFINPVVNSLVYAFKNRSIREFVCKLFKTQF